jgi:uncharacterized protein
VIPMRAAGLAPHQISTMLLAVFATVAEPAPPPAPHLAQSTAAIQTAPGQPISMNSHGFQITGRFFSGKAGGPRPTLILLPGWPGGTGDVLGLGGRLSDAGVNVLMVIPRGMHGSEGTNTFANTLEDIGAALAWLRSDSIAERFRVDPSRLSLGGWSWGGGLALAYAATDHGIRQVISVAGTDHGWFIRQMQKNVEMASTIRGMWEQARAPAGPVRFDPDGFWQELVEGQHIYGLRENAVRLADRRILLIGGWEDWQIPVDSILLPLYRALKAAGAGDVTISTYHADHGFGAVRARLAEDIAAWIHAAAPSEPPANTAHAGALKGPST